MYLMKITKNQIFNEDEGLFILNFISSKFLEQIKIPEIPNFFKLINSLYKYERDKNKIGRLSNKVFEIYRDSLKIDNLELNCLAILTIKNLIYNKQIQNTDFNACFLIQQYKIDTLIENFTTSTNKSLSLSASSFITIFQKSIIDLEHFDENDFE